VSSDAFGLLLAVTGFAVLAGGAIWFVRPAVRRNPVVRGAMVVALTALIVELGFLALFMISVSGLPDMRDF
jgi:hypothetical protein